MIWTGLGGGLAWEAHLGGFLFGALSGPRFLPSIEDGKDAGPAPPTDAGQLDFNGGAL
jgi:hypothetical protein